MKKHSEIAYRIARAFEDLAPASDILLAMEERWNGSGYPKGLKGGEIPRLARVFSILDSYDIMTHPRPYGPAMSAEEALNELKQEAGKQFDPELVGRFVEKETVSSKR
jgi:HD-GYP domain-containing protein (c-di-GMP phosphodiesterase class II)